MRNLVFLLAVLAPLSLAAPALADVPPPDSTGCDMKAAGDVCKADDGSDHTCVASKCTVLDYSDGSPPGTKEVDCLLCTGAASANPPADEDDGGCSVRNHAAAGAAGAWMLGAAVLVVARRLRAPSQKRRR